MLDREQLQQFWASTIDVLKTVSAEAVAWAAIVVIHLATVPSMLAVMSGYSNDLPPADLVLMIWAALILFLLRAALKRDILQMLTIGAGFAAQASMLVLLFFK
jgi:hypothetical protein